jgi:hypothetical protein
VEIRLTPERPPRVQTLNLTAVMDPPGALYLLASRIATALGDADPCWPSDGPPLRDPAGEVTLLLRTAAAWTGSARVVEVLSSDGVSEALFRLVGSRGQVALGLATDPAVGAVTTVSFLPVG